MTEKIKRLERYAFFRAAGYTVVAAGMFISAFITSQGIVPSSVGTVSLLTAYLELVKLLEQREGVIKDGKNAYLCRLANVG